MFFSVLTSILITCCFCIYYFYHKRVNHFKKLGIPYLAPITLLGNQGIPALRRKHAHETFEDIYNYNKDAKYIGFFHYFLEPIVMVRDLDLIKDITIRHFDHFSSRPSPFEGTKDPLLDGNLKTVNGDKWRKIRYILSPTFTANKIRCMRKEVTECTKNFIEHVAELANDSQQAIDTKSLFHKYSTDAIINCGFSLKNNSFKGDNGFYEVGRQTTIPDFLKMLKIVITKSMPKLSQMLGIYVVPKWTVKFFTNFIGSTIAYRNEKGFKQQDVIQLLMDARGKTCPNIKLDVKEITTQAYIMFAAAFEAVAVQLCTMAHELAINADIQDRLQSEIDEVLIETNNNPTYDAINAMPYLDAIFYEALRLHPPQGVLMRRCTKAYEMPAALPGGKPLIIPPGTQIMIPVTAIHRDPKYYENPKKFDPERYFRMREGGKRPVQFGFGSGPRSCIGMRFSLMEVKILIFYLLEKFTLKPHATKTCNPFVYDRTAVFVTAKGGFWLSIEARK